LKLFWFFKHSSIIELWILPFFSPNVPCFYSESWNLFIILESGHFLKHLALWHAVSFIHLADNHKLLWLQAYRHELLEAWDCCMKYKRTVKEAELTQVW
jgi:hypothetical protein